MCLDEWQDILDCCRDNKLCAIYATVDIVIHSKPPCMTQYFQIDCVQLVHTRDLACQLPGAALASARVMPLDLCLVLHKPSDS